MSQKRATDNLPLKRHIVGGICLILGSLHVFIRKVMEPPYPRIYIKLRRGHPNVQHCRRHNGPARNAGSIPTPVEFGLGQQSIARKPGHVTRYEMVNHVSKEWVVEIRKLGMQSAAPGSMFIVSWRPAPGQELSL